MRASYAPRLQPLLLFVSEYFFAALFYKRELCSRVIAETAVLRPGRSAFEGAQEIVVGAEHEVVFELSEGDVFSVVEACVELDVIRFGSLVAWTEPSVRGYDRSVEV